MASATPQHRNKNLLNKNQKQQKTTVELKIPEEQLESYAVGPVGKVMQTIIFSRQ